MEFYEVVKNRKSIKDFKDTPLDRNKISRMINAAMMAPSWKNNTSYKFIIVDDEVEKNNLAGAIVNNDSEAADAVRKAPAAVVIAADPAQSGEIAQRDYYLVDSAIAMEHLVLAATAEGYGTCWIGSLDEDKVRNILSIPGKYRVVAMTPVGEIEAREPHHAKKDVNDYVFYNSWDKQFTESNIKH